MNTISTTHAAQHTMIVISAGTYLGASLGLKVCGPMMLPAQYAIRYKAATVVFFVYPATLVAMSESKATKPVGLDCVK